MIKYLNVESLIQYKIIAGCGQIEKQAYGRNIQEKEEM